jgi:SAM-dependent methyltransferase
MPVVFISLRNDMIEAVRRAFRENSVFSFNLVNRDRWVAQEAAKLPGDSRVLDVGAGSCPYRSLFAHCDYRTQDVGSLRGDQLRHGGYGRIDFVGDASVIDTEDGSFDAILCTEMLEHHPEPIRVVHEFGRILRPGGTLLLTAPLGSGIHQEPFHYYGGYTPYWYQRFLAEAGFDSIEIESNGGFFRFFGQESIRFIRMSVPWRLSTHLFLKLLWFPIWTILMPICALVFPLLGTLLDSLDRERRFTVGYHVKACRTVKSPGS